MAYSHWHLLQLDKSLKKFGFPVGPLCTRWFESVCLEAFSHSQPCRTRGHEALHEAGKGKSCSLLRTRLTDGALDRRGGDCAANEREVHQRGDLLPPGSPPLPAVKALKPFQDGVIRNAQDGDIAAIFGIGFPPFTGGPVNTRMPHARADRQQFRYIDRIGVSKYVDELNK
eukprot:768707-Hanusia_phi.AAC.3